MTENGLIVLVNAYAEKLFGYKREEIIGHPIETLLPERFRAQHPTLRAEFLAAPSPRWMGVGRELFARRKDGTETPVEIGTSPIQSEEGILVLAVIVDIPARKQAEAEARQYREELGHLGRLEILGEMAASLAHELNQPLTGITNSASAGRRFIARGKADIPKLDELLEAVVGDAQRAGNIIRNVRGMTRKGEGVRTSVDLNDLVSDVALFIHSDALERDCVVVTEPDPNLPLVKGNPVLLQQVLLNIIINAFDAMEKTPLEKRRVIVRTERDTSGGAPVSVRDFGINLPIEDPERIFRQFFSTKAEGTGLGLVIARSIIASHGGGLGASNAEGGGSCVNFSLPPNLEGPV